VVSGPTADNAAQTVLSTKSRGCLAIAHEPEVVVVRPAPPLWQVIVRDASYRVLTIEIPDSSTVAGLREQLKDCLIAET